MRQHACAMRQRLGANLDYIVAVGRALSQEIGDQHVFVQPDG
jgi:hypothetical protein